MAKEKCSRSRAERVDRAAGNSAADRRYLMPRMTSMSNSRIFLRKVLRLRPEQLRRPDLVAARRRQGQQDQRPLDLAQHPVVEPGGRQGVLVRGEIVARDAVRPRRASPSFCRHRRQLAGRHRLGQLRLDRRRRRSPPANRAPRGGGSGSPARAHCRASDSAFSRSIAACIERLAPASPRRRPARGNGATSAGMSSLRSRSGGRRIGTTLRR